VNHLLPPRVAAGISRFVFHIIALLAFAVPRASAEDWRAALVTSLKNGGALALDDSDNVLFSHRSKEQFIPASTIKLATILAALELLGPDYRFRTDFSLTKDGILVVKGYGDPQLVSEVLDEIAARVAGETREIKGLLLDDSFFSPTLSLDGVDGTTNPYDAQNGALVANFNTAFLKRTKRGELQSAEPQTPLVPIARKLARIAPGANARVNLGADRTVALQYFGELFVAFLEKHGVRVSGSIRFGAAPPEAHLLFTHLCPLSLEKLSQQILRLSTNFGANQIFLTLGAVRSAPPATYAKGSKVVTEFLKNRVGLKDFQIVEGSGLSRKNLISPVDLVRLVTAYRTKMELLPEKERRYRAKTGSLNGVGALAGVMEIAGRGPVRFAIMVNAPVDFQYKFRLADRLYEGLLSDSP